MNYLILHYFFIIYICNRKLSFAGRRAGNYDIDDFISQLLASQKFDELAEKVADMAVKKIKSMDGRAAFVDKIINNKNLNEEEPHHTYEEKKRDYDKKEIAYRDRGQRSSKNVDSVKPGKIDPEVLMKKEDDSSQSDSLTLKYRYLKQHAMEKRVSTHNVEKQQAERSDSEEHSHKWRNVENSDEKHKLKQIPIEQRAQEPIQIHQIRHDSVEKDDEMNVKERSRDDKTDTPSIKNYERDRERSSKGNVNQSFKDRFFNEHEREERERNVRDNRNPMNNERARDEPTTKKGNERNEKPLFETEQKVNDEVVKPTSIDLDEKYESRAKQVTEGEPNNVYKEIDEQQNTGKAEYIDEGEEEEHKVKEEGNVFVDDQKGLVDEASDEDDAYRGPDNDNAVTGDGEEYTTRKRLIRREGNRLYTYLSAPEYEEYHEMLAKQPKNQTNPFDMI